MKSNKILKGKSQKEIQEKLESIENIQEKLFISSKHNITKGVKDAINNGAKMYGYYTIKCAFYFENKELIDFLTPKFSDIQLKYAKQIATSNKNGNTIPYEFMVIYPI